LEANERSGEVTQTESIVGREREALFEGKEGNSSAE